jgi:hypothetical protein
MSATPQGPHTGRVQSKAGTHPMPTGRARHRSVRPLAPDLRRCAEQADVRRGGNHGKAEQSPRAFSASITSELLPETALREATCAQHGKPRPERNQDEPAMRIIPTSTDDMNESVTIWTKSGCETPLTGGA